MILFRGELNDFTTDSVRERLTPELNKLEDWLYDEGEDLTKSAYAEKLNALKAEGEVRALFSILNMFFTHMGAAD